MNDKKELEKLKGVLIQSIKGLTIKEFLEYPDRAILLYDSDEFQLNLIIK